MSNKYIEKVASLLAGAAIAHVGQNLITRKAIRSKSVAKYIADSFATGAKGGYDASKSAVAKRLTSAVVAPDVNIMHRNANELGQRLKPVLDKMHPRAKAGMRMLAEGRLDQFEKLKHRIPESAMKKGTRVMDSLGLSHKVLSSAKHLWRDESHPLLSNIVKNLGRGKPAEHIAPGRIPLKPDLVATGASMIADPAAGALSTTKMLTQSRHVNATKPGKFAVDKIHEVLLKNPTKKGYVAGVTGKASSKMDRLKDAVLDYGINSTSATLKRTSNEVGHLMREVKKP